MRIIPVVIAALPLAHVSLAAVATGDAQVLFEQKCVACHTIGGGKRIGPDLRDVTVQRPAQWLVRWITRPDQMLADKDPTAMRLLAESGGIQMPNLGVTESEARALIDYIREQSTGPSAAAAVAAPVPAVLPPPQLGPVQRVALELFLGLTVVIAIVFFGVATSTRHPRSLDTKKAYQLRRVFFVLAAGALLVAFIATVGRTPYAAVQGRPDRVVYVAARQFDFFFSAEPIVSVEDLSQVPVAHALELPAGTDVEFRVTALDVNHNFALYGPERRLIAQTQAMPGYVNRLRVRLTTPGHYEVLCLEYCGAGHHLMRAGLTVR